MDFSVVLKEHFHAGTASMVSRTFPDWPLMLGILGGGMSRARGAKKKASNVHLLVFFVCSHVFCVVCFVETSTHKRDQFTMIIHIEVE